MNLHKTNEIKLYPSETVLNILEQTMKNGYPHSCCDTGQWHQREWLPFTNWRRVFELLTNLRLEKGQLKILSWHPPQDIIWDLGPPWTQCCCCWSKFICHLWESHKLLTLNICVAGICKLKETWIKSLLSPLV